VLGEFTASSDTYYLMGLDVVGQRQGTNWSYFGYDGLGSTRFLTNPAGVATYNATYDPYGSLIQSFGASNARLGYAGEYTDPSGLVYLRARYMNPSLGMFLSRDPFEGVMERIMSRNGYTYVEGNPINLSDPSGENPFAAAIALAANPFALAAGAAVLGLACAATPACRNAVSDYLEKTFRDTDDYVNKCITDVREELEEIFKPEIIEAVHDLYSQPLTNPGLSRPLPPALLPLVPPILPPFVEIFPAIPPIVISPIIYSSIPDIGRKLEYLFGNATSNQHNIDRSIQMERQLNSIGIFDNENGRLYINEVLNNTVNNPNNIVGTQENGRIVRETLLAGPDGFLKMETIWDGDRLITFNLFGTGR